MVDNPTPKNEIDVSSHVGENGKFIYSKKGAITFPKIVESSIQDILILDISCNQLRDIPSTIGTFSAVEELYCSRNLISKLSHALVQLNNLAVLDLSFNQLSCLPACISHIGSLCQLWLSHNRITTLPEEVGKNLTRLQLLDVSANQLTHLPKSLSRLSRLRVLSANSNLVQEIPREFGQLKLHKLDLRNNQITKLPYELHKLSEQLRELAIGGNPLVHPPIQLSHLGPAHLLHYLRTVSFDSFTNCATTRPDDGRGKRPNSSNRTRLSHHTHHSLYPNQAGTQYRNKQRRALREIKDKHINSRAAQSPRDPHIPDYRLPSKSSPPDIPPSLSISSTLNNGGRHYSVPGGVDSGYNTAVRTEETAVGAGHNKARPTANPMLMSVDARRWNSPLFWTPPPPETRSTASGKSNEFESSGGECTPVAQSAAPLVDSPVLHDSPISPACPPSDANVLHNLFPLLSNNPTTVNERRRLMTESNKAHLPMSKHHSLSVINAGANDVSLRHFPSSAVTPGESGSNNVQNNAGNMTQQMESFAQLINSSSTRVPLIGSSDYPLNRIHEYHRESSRDTQGSSSPIQQLLSPPLISSTLVQSLNKNSMGRGDPLENRKWNDIVRKAREKKSKEIRKMESSKGSTVAATSLASSNYVYRESEPLYQLRMILEGHLNTTLPCDLAAALQDGRLLCQFANQVAPKSAGTTVVHQPQEGQAMLALAKCRRNLENFTAACRKVGVPEEDLFNIQAVLDGTTSSLIHVSRCVQAFIQQAPWHLSLDTEAANVMKHASVSPGLKNGESGFVLNPARKDERAVGSTTPDMRRQLFIESDV